MLLIAQLLTPTVALAQQVIRSTTTIVGETLTFVLDRAISLYVESDESDGGISARMGTFGNLRITDVRPGLEGQGDCSCGRLD